MKQKYIITRGSYDDYSWIAHLEGDTQPSLSELYKQFCDEYGYVPEPSLDSEAHDTEFEAHLMSIRQMFDSVHMSGEDYFVHWLKEKHGFINVDIQVFHV
jgi:hypothetical protein